MKENSIKQKRKLGLSVGLIILIPNVVSLLLSLLLKKLGVETAENKYIFAYIINAVSIYVVGYTVFRLFLRKTEHVENREKKKLKFWEFILFICVTIGGTQFVNLIFQVIVMIVKSALNIQINNNVAELIQNANPVLTVFFAVILGPTFEELIFRGTLLKRLRVYGDKTAIIYTAIMFGLFHCNIEQIPFAIACGLILGYAYTKTNNLLYPITFHICMNGFSILLSVFLKNGMMSAVILQEAILMILIILALVFVPVFLTTGRVKVTNNEAVYDNKKLYRNIGFVCTTVITAVFTVLGMFKF